MWTGSCAAPTQEGGGGYIELFKLLQFRLAVKNHLNNPSLGRKNALPKNIREKEDTSESMNEVFV